MSALAHLMIALLIYCTVRAMFRRLTRRDPMAGRLVARGAFIPLPHQRETIEQLLKRIEAERERERAARVSAPIDMLAAYRPKSEL